MPKLVQKQITISTYDCGLAHQHSVEADAIRCIANQTRNAKIIAASKNGLNDSQIGEIHGISATQVSNICRKAGRLPRKPHLSVEQRRVRNLQIVKGHKRGITFRKLGEKYGLNPTSCKQICDEYGHPAMSPRNWRFGTV